MAWKIGTFARAARGVLAPAVKSTLLQVLWNSINKTVIQRHINHRARVCLRLHGAWWRVRIVSRLVATGVVFYFTTKTFTTPVSVIKRQKFDGSTIKQSRVPVTRIRWPRCWCRRIRHI